MTSPEAKKATAHVERVRAKGDDSGSDLIERTADTLRLRLTEGLIAPGDQLRETGLTEELGVSRNTLREVFRILMHEGLLERAPHRGVFVRRPTVLDVLDIYRVRRMIEVQSVLQAVPGHQSIGLARAAADEAKQAQANGDWDLVGTKNFAFHAALVGLADSARLNTLFSRMQAELRLAFTSLASPEQAYVPFVDVNDRIATLLEQGQADEAATELNTYFDRSERMALAALSGL